ncbi:MAG: guanylate kinase [Actinomycetota bacterium]|nr:guanylate kinase [Actinomycetota bacterium]MED5220364.1 guanylate kinase [Actinomycetota bacterium]MED5233109.1 guanylate kinase [Actinomycetota bacterium]MEE3353315.1 guanylate kinase [Actinomycetota bacterium]
MLLVVMSGPGGAGKGTIARALVEGDPRLTLSRSWTTRDRRVDDVQDAYVFVTRAEFEARRDAAGFLEWNEFLGHAYGTPVPEESDDRDLLLEIDVAGGRQVLERLPDALCLFVDAPDDELCRRLIERGEGRERAEQRIAEAARERADAGDLGYRRVVNDDLETAIVEVRDLIDAARAGA